MEIDIKARAALRQRVSDIMAGACGEDVNNEAFFLTPRFAE